MNATFNVILITPIGTKKGVVTFLDKNGVLSGSIRAMGRSNYFKSGKIIGNSFEFSGILSAGFFNFRYTAKGTIDGDTLKAIATTNSGTFQINGMRAA